MLCLYGFWYVIVVNSYAVLPADAVTVFDGPLGLGNGAPDATRLLVGAIAGALLVPSAAIGARALLAARVCLPFAQRGERPLFSVRWVIAAACAASIAVWASPISTFQMRFLIPLVPVLAVLSAIGAQRLIDATRGVTRVDAPVSIAAIWHFGSTQQCCLICIYNDTRFALYHLIDPTGTARA
jgi:hypothetical protein